MTKRVPSEIFKRFQGASIALAIVLVVGSAGYYFIAEPKSRSIIDAVYMTVITITSIGYGEIVDLSNNPGGRVFTMAIALAGIGTATYLLSTFTAFIVEGDLSETFRRRQMEKQARNQRDHYIVCGAGRVGFHIVQELRVTHHPCVVVDPDAANLKALREKFEDVIYLEADGTDNDTLLKAGIASAAGLFAAMEDEHQNLVISLTARQLNPRITIVARCGEVKNVEKMKAAGANVVISPTFIGGLRMASEMIRPTVVSFLDVMLRDKERNLRIEEVPVGPAGRKIGELGLERFENTLLLAIRSPAGWTYNPKPTHVLESGSRLIVMTTPEERADMEKTLAEEIADRTRPV